MVRWLERKRLAVWAFLLHLPTANLRSLSWLESLWYGWIQECQISVVGSFFTKEPWRIEKAITSSWLNQSFEVDRTVQYSACHSEESSHLLILDQAYQLGKKRPTNASPLVIWHRNVLFCPREHCIRRYQKKKSHIIYSSIIS